jgi:hypothetical protein
VAKHSARNICALCSRSIFVPAFAQLQNHLVEAATKDAAFAATVRKTYRDIEVAFRNARHLGLNFRHNKPQIIVTFGSAKSFVSVFLQQNQWRQYIHRRSALTVDLDHVYNRRVKGVCPKLLKEHRISSQWVSCGGHRSVLCHFFQRGFVQDDQTGTVQLDELLLLENSKQAADGLAGRSDHLPDFPMRQNQMKMQRMI